MSPAQDRSQDNSPVDWEADFRRMSAAETFGDDEAVSAAGAHGNESMARLLLIEDDKETADELRAVLGDRGFEVDWAANGIEGLDKARTGRAEAMIVDRLLPGMDGLTIIEALRHEGMRTPVLVLSALGAVDDRVRGLRAGGDGLSDQAICNRRAHSPNRGAVAPADGKPRYGAAGRAA
jgi:CheY-like chemotaxis protein